MHTLLLWAIQCVLAAACAMLGALILWKTIGKGLIRKHAGDWIWNAIEEMGDDLECEKNQKVSAFANAQLAYMVRAILTDFETPEGRERWKPFLAIFTHYAQQVIFGTWGAVLEKLRKEGNSLGDLPGELANLPPEMLGVAQKIFPNADIPQTLKAFSWLSSRVGGAEGNAPSPSSAPSRQLGYNPGVTQ